MKKSKCIIAKNNVWSSLPSSSDISLKVGTQDIEMESLKNIIKLFALEIGISRRFEIIKVGVVGV